ncbi:hypothetical protein ARMGADRAFT_1069193 [Armillaria gallica]|uniref:Uncharacterized protein n=1 Tax=Armillaria gallica TaxID=47427 RepID=A0A2H3CXF7_ARMGA|nr:hypothetical protein ARMGADRAFT_1069193 [Armillaria gallica]
MILFMNECFLIILIAYPILFLTNLYFHVAHITPTLLLGVTVVSTLVVSAVVELVLVLWGRTEEEEASCDLEKEALSLEDKPILGLDCTGDSEFESSAYSKPMSPVLPQEIADNIVDLVYGRYLPDFRKEWQPELFACSLVCKSWTPRTRYYLFRDIVVVSMDQPSFMQLISDPRLCTFAPYPRSVCINDSSMPPAKVDWFVLKVLPALSMFPNIESMYIAYSSGFLLTKSEEEWDAVLKSVSRLNNVVDLRLEECQFRTYDHFASLLSSFRVLETVTLDRCKVFKIDPEFRSTIIPPSSLHTTAHSIVLLVVTQTLHFFIVISDGDVYTTAE